MAIEALSGWTREQKSVVVAAYLGWTLDAFDFFLMVFVFRDIAKEFNTGIPAVAFAVVLTLALRPIGAFIFGRCADRFGRRPTLMADILIYSVLAFASGFAQSLTQLLVLRALFGIAMGGEWGVGASITMETIPPKARGFVSGLLQCGYPSGYLFASVVYAVLFQYIGWRGMFMIGIVPALLTFYILKNVKESPGWTPRKEPAGDAVLTLTAYGRLVIYAVLLWVGAGLYADQPGIAAVCVAAPLIASVFLASRDPGVWIEFFAVLAMLFVDYFSLVAHFIPSIMAIIYNVAAILAGVFLKTHWRMGIYAVLLMTAFNFFSHGTQDLYPTFLQVQKGFSPATVGAIAVVYNIGAIVGSLSFGFLSERIGRRRAIVLAALISIPIIPLWVFAGSPVWLAVGSFMMQFAVQAAWGIVPVHLNELSPAEVRGTFPGFVYQLGNLLASVNATIQAGYAAQHGNDYATALALIALGAAIGIALLVGFGIERKGVHLGTGESQPTGGLVRLTPQEAE
jgi:MFS transporter, SHS family, lactate transporter